MYSADLTSALPPHTERLPRILPLSWFKGATPTSLLISRRLSRPSSGSAAISTALVPSPMPLKPSSSLSFCAKCCLSRFPMSSSSVLICLSSSLMTAWMLLADRAWARFKRLLSATRICTSCDRRVTSACSCSCCGVAILNSSLSNLSLPCKVRAKCDSIRASIPSVLARYPIDLANSCACLGLATTTVMPARYSACAQRFSRPPVASSSTTATLWPARCSSRALTPCSSLTKRTLAALSAKATSRLSLDTSMPTYTGSRVSFVMAHPCKNTRSMLALNGLALPTSNCSGFLQTVGCPRLVLSPGMQCFQRGVRAVDNFPFPCPEHRGFKDTRGVSQCFPHSRS